MGTSRSAQSEGTPVKWWLAAAGDESTFWRAAQHAHRAAGEHGRTRGRYRSDRFIERGDPAGEAREKCVLHYQGFAG